ncbi:MAG: alpha/beta fold hydrolase [Planctomycetota bacterium]
MRELTLPAPVMLLPGLGTDGGIFSPQKQAFGSMVDTPAWISPKSNQESLSSYAARWASQLNEQIAGYPADRPWFLGGLSLGGMLALELVPHLSRPPEAVFLIASCRSVAALTMPIKLAAGLAGVLPAVWFKRLARWCALPIGYRDGQDDLGNRLLSKMIREADEDWLKWSIGAMGEWTYTGPPDNPKSTAGDVDFPALFQIHGQEDWLIPVKPADCDHVILNAQHLITLSHPHTVNRWLFDHVVRCCDIDESSEPRVEDPDATLRRRPEFADQF